MPFQSEFSIEGSTAFHGMHYKDKVAQLIVRLEERTPKKKGEGIEPGRMQMPNLHLDSSAPRKEIPTEDCKSDSMGSYEGFLVSESILSMIR